jgi:hypothetical protein
VIARLVATSLALMAGAAAAVVDWREEMKLCVDTHRADDKALSECVRAVARNKAEEEDAEAAKNQPQLKEFTVKIRDSSASTANFGQYELGQKGASWSLLHEKGVQSHNASAGIFGYWRPLDPNGRFQPFIGASAVRKGSGTDKKDIRDFTVGTTGPILLRPEVGEFVGPKAVALVHTFQITRREDKYGASEGDIYRVHGDLVWQPLATGRWLWLEVVPQAGFLWERRTGGGTEDGHWRSGYAGILASKSIGRLQASLTARWLRDFRAPAGNNKRRDDFVSLSLDYYFYDPGNTTAPFQPSVFITRKVGNDFLTGVSEANRTEAGLRVKFN